MAGHKGNASGRRNRGGSAGCRREAVTAEAAVMPGVHGTERPRRLPPAGSSPPRRQSGRIALPPFRRTTVLPAFAASISIWLVSCCGAECSPARLPTQICSRASRRIGSHAVGDRWLVERHVRVCHAQPFGEPASPSPRAHQNDLRPYLPGLSSSSSGFSAP